MLLQNTIIAGQSPLRFRGGTTLQERSQWAASFGLGNQHASNAQFSGKAAVPNGALAPASWLLPQKPGGMSAYKGIDGTGTLTASGALGVNGEAALTGSGDLTATGQLVVSGSANLTGTGALTGNIIASLAAVANLTGSGTLTADVTAKANATASLVGTGTLTADIRATGSMAADIAAEDVGFTAADAEKIDELHRIHGLNADTPLTVSTSARAAGVISQTISTGSGTTTVTRV
jgi:hypothetical protein